MLKDKIQNDLKQAMLQRNAVEVSVLKGIKTAILYAEVEQKKRDSGLSDDEILAVLQKEAKKRVESAEAYQKALNQERSDAELAEKDIIDRYLPEPLSEQEVKDAIATVVKELDITTPERKDMGRIIGVLKQRHGAQLDGALAAKLVAERVAD